MWWMDLTTCDVSASPEAVVFQMHAKEMIRPPDDGSKTRVRCSEQIRELYVEIKWRAFQVVALEPA